MGAVRGAESVIHVEIGQCGQLAGKFFVVGFAAETNDLETNAKKKLEEKNLDMIVANDVSRSDIGMESAENEVTIFFRDGETKTIARTSKKNIARELIKIISNTKKNV